jgi:hypothetical protein
MADLSSRLKLFMSVDVSGSTAIKNRRNHTITLDIFEQRKAVIASYLEKAAIPMKEDSISFDDPNFIRMVFSDRSAEDMDYGGILHALYLDFDDQFEGNVAELLQDCTRHLWKFLGDELIYVFDILNRPQLFDIVRVFLQTIYSVDQAYITKHSIRLKGSAWVAGFPVRNRIVSFPSFNRSPEHDGIKQASYIHEDYLGPDMDTGFRIGKYTHPGLLSVSMELLELILGTPPNRNGNDFRIKVVGWRSLKGVWDNLPYPIIWLDLSQNYVDSQDGVVHGTNHNHTFPLWRVASDEMIAEWLKPQSSFQVLHDIVSETRKSLPKHLGLEIPYIVPEDGEAKIPDSHKKILQILGALENNANYENIRETTDGIQPSQTEAAISSELVI